MPEGIVLVRERLTDSPQSVYFKNTELRLLQEKLKGEMKIATRDTQGSRNARQFDEYFIRQAAN